MENFNEENHIKQGVINWFISLINFKTKEQNKSTIMANLAGHIGRHMDKNLRQWFMARYPNREDYPRFFNENKEIFTYDYMTGEIKLNTSSPFVKPNYLKALEREATLLEKETSDDSLLNASKIILKYEIIHFVYTTLKTMFNDRRQNAILVDELKQIVMDVDQFNEKIEREYSNFNQFCRFIELKLHELFIFDKNEDLISLKMNLLKKLPEVTKEIDSTSYELVKVFVSKMLIKWSKDNQNGMEKATIDFLEEKLRKRHPHIYYYMFDGGLSQDYNFTDFIYSYNGECFNVVNVNGIHYIDLISTILK